MTSWSVIETISLIQNIPPPPPHRVEDLCSDLFSNLYGLQTEHNESKLIDIDRNYNINKLSRI